MGKPDTRRNGETGTAQDNGRTPDRRTGNEPGTPTGEPETPTELGPGSWLAAGRAR